MRLLPEQRRSMVDAVRRGFTKVLVAEVYNVSRKTVTTWCKRAKDRGRASLKDKKPARREAKITLEAEVSIIALRKTHLRRGHGANLAGAHYVARIRKGSDYQLCSRFETVKNE